MQPINKARLGATRGLPSRPVLSRRAVSCRAQAPNAGQELRQRLAAAGAALTLGLATLSGAAPAAFASEFDILGSDKPAQYYVDDANVLSKATRGELTQKLKQLQFDTGYRLEVVTVRKLEFETDSFTFADKVRAGWYGEDGKREGVMVVVTAAKEGAIVGSKSFVEAVTDDLIDDITTTNIPIYTEDEKYNQTVLSSVERIEAKLRNQTVPEGPKRDDGERKRTYKTKAETESTKSVTTTVVASLLLIAVVVPMLQYYGYVAKD